jgi:drug/metabolite transporter (DMT)-like permease
MAEVAVAGSPEAPSRTLLILAFGALYVIWGSTYLAIRFALETTPPFLMAGARFVVAGGLLFLWARWRGAPAPNRRELGAAVVIGALLLVGGNGGVVWAEQRVPSSLAALLVSIMPLWVVLGDWLRPGGSAPSRGVWLGVLGGLVGVVYLIDPTQAIGSGAIDPMGAVVLVLATLSWAVGSMWSRGAPVPASPILGTGIQMLAGGVLLLLLAAGTGEFGSFAWSEVSMRSWLAVAYLVLFGAIVAYTAYVWLLRVAPTARVATYAYVNPVVAVFLGWAFAGEELTSRTLVAAAVILGAVALVTTAKNRAPA